MFGFARKILQHKVGVVAVLAFGVFVFSRDGAEEQKPSSPWSQQAAATVASSEGDGENSVIGEYAGKAVTAASEYIGETTGINPEEMTEQAVGNFDKTAKAYEKANNRE